MTEFAAERRAIGPHSLAVLNLLVRQPDPADLTSMSCRDFERLIGRAFRLRGFKVTGFGGGGQAGGGDFALTKNGERFLVQCKYWRKQQVGVTVVRELSAILGMVGASGGYVISSGRFTREAREFALRSRVLLIDGDALRALLPAGQPAASNDVMVTNDL